MNLYPEAPDCSSLKQGFEIPKHLRGVQWRGLGLPLKSPGASERSTNWFVSDPPLLDSRLVTADPSPFLRPFGGRSPRSPRPGSLDFRRLGICLEAKVLFGGTRVFSGFEAKPAGSHIYCSPEGTHTKDTHDTPKARKVHFAPPVFCLGFGHASGLQAVSILHREISLKA